MCNDAGQREIVPMPFNPIYDLLEREYQVCGSQWEAFAESWTAENWLNNGLRNSVDRTSTTVLPWGIFEDSATYKGKGVGQVDSIETAYINALSMKRRHIVYALPKSRYCGEECGCPCRGRCTKNAIDKIMLFLHSMLPQGKGQKDATTTSPSRKDCEGNVVAKTSSKAKTFAFLVSNIAPTGCG